MLVKIFSGVNWKLASEKKWKEDEIDEHQVLEKVGVAFGNDVHRIGSGFAMILPQESQTQEERVRYYICACGGNVNISVGASSDGEARSRFHKLLKEWKAIGTLLVKRNGIVERLEVFSGKDEA